jgi:predicted DNA-binding antitoxin AbrB/MazE fold protein
MAITVEAVYENGVLKPTTPLPLSEQDHVEVTLTPRPGWAREIYGILGWTGSPEDAERFATDPELAFPPSEGA